MTMTSPAVPAADTPPTLRLHVVAASPAPAAVVPTLRFRTRIDSAAGRPVSAITLHAQIRILAAQRQYDPASQRRLRELFGRPAQWDRSLRSLMWTEADAPVPAFTGSTEVDIPVPCTYDFEVAASKYLQALGSGEVPLEFLFTGTIFYPVNGMLRAARLPWDCDAQFRMPVTVWRELMDRYFPDATWLRLRHETFDRLYAYRVARTLTNWEDTVADLLARAGKDETGQGRESEHPEREGS